MLFSMFLGNVNSQFGHLIASTNFDDRICNLQQICLDWEDYNHF